MLRAGYAFTAITYAEVEAGEGERTFFGKLVAPDQYATSELSSIDIITCAAQLASDPTAIDLLLDKLLFISSHLQPGETLTPQQEATLKDVYLEIEQYLITKDPVRHFNQTELRQTIQTALKLAEPERASKTFWPTLNQKDVVTQQ